MTYQLTTGTSIKRLSDGAFIPPDPANVDYQAYLAWVQEGNKPAAAPPPPVAPSAAEQPLIQRLQGLGVSLEELRAALQGSGEQPQPLQPKSTSTGAR